MVNASSEEGRLAVNGMSYRSRDSKNANSAIIISVTPEDFPKPDHPLSGVVFQRKLEEAAWKLAEGKVPQQLYADFKENKKAPVMVLLKVVSKVSMLLQICGRCFRKQ